MEGLIIVEPVPPSPKWFQHEIEIYADSEGWDEEFDTEKAAYEKVKPLRGIVVPKCYGELKYKGTRSLLLSDVGGENLATPEGALLEVTDLRRMLHDAFSALAQFGLSHDDTKLDNFHVVGDKVMVLDLERVDGNLSDERFAFHIKCDVNHLAQKYEDNQHCFYIDGLIMVDT
ncbi:Protein kinase-like domain protein [Hirsutella rhossiliensis]